MIRQCARERGDSVLKLETGAANRPERACCGIRKHVGLEGPVLYEFRVETAVASMTNVLWHA